MSTIAQSRDLSDRKTIENFAARRAVAGAHEAAARSSPPRTSGRSGPGVWNSAGRRSSCARSITRPSRCSPAASRRSTAPSASRMAQAEFRAETEGLERRTSSTPISTRHYPAYWLKVDLPHKVSHAHFLKSAQAAGKAVATGVGFDTARGVTELTVLAPDHPRLLVGHRRRLRGGGRQHRRRADLHHHRRARARHHRGVARVRAQRGRGAPRGAHRGFDRARAARRVAAARRDGEARRAQGAAQGLRASSPR